MPSRPSQNPAHASRTASRPWTGSALPKRIVTSSARWRVKRSGSIESMSANSCDRSGMAVVYTRTMFEPSMIRGTHHLTFCVGGAQEDYDFHVRLLGLRSVKKTVLFGGEIPISPLYYANRIGDLSTILTSFPYRQAGWMGRRGPNQLRTTNLAAPAASIAYWAVP